MPYTEDPAELAGVDVAIVGAPTDDLVSDRPGARFGPRAIRAASCPPGPASRGRRSTASRELRVVDFGDAPGAARRPGREPRGDRAHRRRGARRRRAPDRPRRRPRHRRARHPRLRRRPRRRVGLVHFDTHTDTGAEVFGVEVSHGTPMRRLVEAGHGRSAALRRRSACAATGRARRSSPGRPSAASPASSCTTSASSASRGGRARRRRGGRGAGLPLGRHRRPRPGLRARHRHPRARRDDERRPAARLPPARQPARARRRRAGRGDPDRGRLGRHHRARRRARRARDRHRDRPQAASGARSPTIAPALRRVLGDEARARRR